MTIQNLRSVEQVLNLVLDEPNRRLRTTGNGDGGGGGPVQNQYLVPTLFTEDFTIPENFALITTNPKFRGKLTIRGKLKVV